jgi:hypothetical protein
MKLDLNSYRTSLDKMLPQILDHKGRRHDRCAELAAVSGIPVLAMVLYALRPEVLGRSEELEKVALDLQAFYKYDEIKDWKEG